MLPVLDFAVEVQSIGHAHADRNAACVRPRKDPRRVSGTTKNTKKSERVYMTSIRQPFSWGLEGGNVRRYRASGRQGLC